MMSEEEHIIHLTDEQYRIAIDKAQEDINNKWKNIINNKIEELENVKLCGGKIWEAICEEKILEFLKTDIAFNEQNGNIKSDIWVSFEKEILNLIDKLQKEIEELKEKYENINWYFENQKDNFVHKNKIREKLKKLRKEEDRISKLDYALEPEKAIDSLLLRIGDLEELLEGE